MSARSRKWPSKQEIRRVEAVLRFAPDVLRMWRKAITLPGGTNQWTMRRDGIRTYNKAATGSSLAYTLDRLKRKKPELYRKVVSGEMSSYAAATAAGFRKQQPTPFGEIKQLLPQLTKRQRRQLKAML